MQNVKLLSAMAPIVSLEQLVYAVRLMNIASSEGPQAAHQLRDLFVKSDCAFDPQAYVLRPDVVIRLAASIIGEVTPYLRTRRAALETLALLRSAHNEGAFAISKTEVRWLDRLSKQADALPEDENKFTASMRKKIDLSKVRLAEYGL